MSEEDVKNNIVLPFLISLGYSKENLSFEYSFKIKRGREELEIGKTKPHNVRADILVKENGTHLCVFEVKNDNVSLSDEDIGQAISYSRFILPEVCPLTILSNGTTTRIFDSLDGKELTNIGIKESCYVKNGYKLQLDEEFYLHAISNFLCLSYDNLKNFCNFQVADTMSRVKTTSVNELKQYIPQVFVNRNKILSSFHDFLNSEKTCLIISGVSDVGKTNTICNLVEEVQKDNPVFFYNAAELTRNLDKCIAMDFNWEFSASKLPEQYIKQLDHILDTHKKELLIFIDAIDEWAIPNIEIELSDIVKRIKEKHIRLILTCKSPRINQFLFNKGIQSALSQNSFEANKEENKIPFILEKFNETELEDASRKYKNFFSIQNEISGSTKEQCKDPSLLRTIAEIYEGKEVPSTLNSVKIYKNYLDKKLEKTEIKSRVKQFLTDLTKIMFDEKCDEIFESELNSVDNEALQFCIDYGIIERTEDPAGRPKLKFRSEGLRNYIITYHMSQLDIMTKDQIDKFAETHLPIPCGRNVLLWYANKTDSENKEELRKKIESDDTRRAKEYLKRFIEISKEDFPFILKKDTGSDLTIGLLVLYNEENNVAIRYGFRPITEKDQELVWINKKDWHPLMKNEHDIMMQYRIGSLGFSHRDFTNELPEDVAYEQVFSFVRSRIKKRNLDEFKNVGICIEKLFAIIPKINTLLGLPEVNEKFLENALPLNINKMMESLEQYTVHGEADIVLSRGSWYRENNTISTEKLKQMLRTISTTSEEIKSTILPLGDTPRAPGWYHINNFDDYSKEGIKNYVEQFFYRFLDEYKILAESNFPTIQEKLHTYKMLPAYVVVQLEKSSRSDKTDGLMYAIFPNDKDENFVEIRDYDEEPIKIIHDDSGGGFLFETKQGQKKAYSYTDTVLDSLFTSYRISGPYRDCPIVNWAYDRLNEDLGLLYGPQYKEF